MVQMMGSKKFLSAYAAAVAAVLVGGSTAQADLLNGWTFQDPNGTGASYTATETTLQLISGDAGVGDADTGLHANYSTVAAIGGTVAFDWSMTTLDIDDFDYHGYVINGAFTQIGNNAGPDNGSETFNVNTGDTFGFYVGTEDGIFGAITVNYSNYSFTAIPEPSALAVLAMGTVGGLALRRRRR
jgi:hypothetical protein